MVVGFLENMYYFSLAHFKCHSSRFFIFREFKEYFLYIINNLLDMTIRTELL